MYLFLAFELVGLTLIFAYTRPRVVAVEPFRRRTDPASSARSSTPAW